MCNALRVLCVIIRSNTGALLRWVAVDSATRCDHEVFVVLVTSPRVHVWVRHFVLGRRFRRFRRCRLDGLLGNLEMTRNGGRALGHSNGGGGVFRQHVHLKCRFSETSIFPGTGMPHLWRCGLLRRRATCRHGLHLLRVHGFNLLSDDLSCSARSSHSHCCSHPFACVLLTVWWMVQPGHDHEADS